MIICFDVILNEFGIVVGEYIFKGIIVYDVNYDLVLIVIDLEGLLFDGDLMLSID